MPQRRGFLIKWTVLATAPAMHSISLSSVIVVENDRSFIIPLWVTGDGKNADQDFILDTLINSGAQGRFLDKKLVLKKGIALTKLKMPMTPINVDGTKNKSGKIEYVTWLNLYFGDIKMITWLLVTDLGKEQIILGLSWLQEYNPTIDWTKGTINISLIKPTRSLDKMLLWSLEITSAEIIPLAPKKPTWEEVYKELDFSSILTPLLPEEPILLNIEEEKEAAINWIETFEDEEQVWINTKTNPTHELTHKAGIPEQPPRGSQSISGIQRGVWKETLWTNAWTKEIGSSNRPQTWFCS